MQKAVHRSRKRNLHRGLYKRTNLGSARNPVDHALESSLDLIGEVRGSRLDFRLRHIDEFSPFGLRPVPEHFGRGIDERG